MPRHLAIALLLITAACGNDVAHTEPPGPTVAAVYYGGVQKIINENCVECHSASPDRLAPFSLATYEDARVAAEEWPISFAVMNRTMPPYYAVDDGSCQTYHDTKWLSDDEIEQLVAWTNGERLAGDPEASIAPPPPRPELARVDHTFDIGAKTGSAYLPDTVKSDDYRCFVVDGLTAEKFATGAHVRPGNPTVVHHVIIYTLETAAAEADVVARDQADPGAGYACDGGPTETGTAFLVGWAPGQQATIFPAGTGIRVAPGRKMVIQMHYNTAHGDGGTDRTTIDLMLETQVANEALMLSVRGNVDLAPGQPDVVATGTKRLPTTVPSGKVWGGMMHMHQRGIAADVTVQRSANSCLLDLQGWSFHWQHMYWYAEPVAVTGGDTLQINCHYDTSDDTTRVTWGEETTNEMCIAYMYISR